MVCNDGVVIVADRRIRDKLIAPESANKIFEVDHHVMATAAGISSDARILIDHAQVLAQQHRLTYGTPVEPLSVIKMIADKKQMFTQYGGARPFGAAVLLAGVNKNKAHLYTTDVTGNFYAYNANAIGENDEKVKEVLRTDFNENMSIDDGIKFCLKIFKDILGKNFEISRFDAGIIRLDNAKLERLHGEALRKFVK